MTKKKVGVVTLALISNYGGILQAYAMQQVLDRLGYESETLTKTLWPRPLSFWGKVCHYPVRWIKKHVLHLPVVVRDETIKQRSVLRWWFMPAVLPQRFVGKYIHRRLIYEYTEVKPTDYDVLLVGSDQIWRPEFAGDCRIQIQDAFLAFTAGWPLRRMAYAASFGADEWGYSKEAADDCSRLIQAFDAVSCREERGTSFCHELLDYPLAVTVLDPTMLLASKDYERLCEGTAPSPGDLFCYVLDRDERSKRIISEVERQTGWSVFEVRSATDNLAASLEDRSWPSVEQWLRAFKDARFVVTDSFHGCVFSIIFRKPFIAIVNERRGTARYKTLLGRFGLEQRMLTGYDAERISVLLDTPLDLDEQLFAEQQSASIRFLQENLP